MKEPGAFARPSLAVMDTTKALKDLRKTMEKARRQMYPNLPPRAKHAPGMTKQTVAARKAKNRARRRAQKGRK